MAARAKAKTTPEETWYGEEAGYNSGSLAGVAPYALVSTAGFPDANNVAQSVVVPVARVSILPIT